MIAIPRLTAASSFRHSARAASSLSAYTTAGFMRAPAQVQQQPVQQQQQPVQQRVITLAQAGGRHVLQDGSLLTRRSEGPASTRLHEGTARRGAISGSTIGSERAQRTPMLPEADESRPLGQAGRARRARAQRNVKEKIHRMIRSLQSFQRSFRKSPEFSSALTRRHTLSSVYPQALCPTPTSTTSI